MTNLFSNIYKASELKEGLTIVFQELQDILKDHSGPFATNSVIGSKWRQVNDVDEFTKDGIKILNNLIVTDHALDRFATRMTRFVGITVDNRCHDGTTTSMLLFAKLALVALDKLDSDLNERLRYKWARLLTKILTLCLDHLKTLKINEEDILERARHLGVETNLSDIRAAIGYHMAMISSKGDHDLAFKVSEIIRSCPKKIYGMFKTTPLAIETDEAYILKKQEEDLIIQGMIGNTQDLNDKNGTQYLSENAVIFATANDIVTHSMESIFLNAFISQDLKKRAHLGDFGDCPYWDDLHEGKKHLVILSPMLNDPTLITEIMLFNKAHPKNKISYFQCQVQPKLRPSWNKTLHYVAGVPIFDDVMSEGAHLSLIGLNRPVTVKAIGSAIALKNLYEKDGDVYHPLFKDPSLFEDYTKFVRETESLLEYCRENISNPALDHDDITYLTMLYRALTCQIIYDIEIGGSIHDQYANRTVYEDAMGAALSAVDEGIVLGGYAHLVNYLKAHLETFPKKDEDNNCDDDDIVFLEKELCSQFKTSLLSLIEESLRVLPYRQIEQHRSFIDVLIDTKLEDKWSYIVARPDLYFETSRNHPDDYIDVQLLGSTKESLNAFLSRSPETVILLQAYAGYEEQFKRFRDILPRLANTTRLSDMRVKDDANLH